MPSSKIVRARKAGWCDGDFAHPARIEVGSRVEVTTYFPSDGECRDFGVQRFTRTRRCQWCIWQDCKEDHAAGMECARCGFVKPRAFWMDNSKPTDSEAHRG